MDVDKVTERSKASSLKYQIISVGYSLVVNSHHLNTVTRLGKDYLRTSHYCHYMQ